VQDIIRKEIIVKASKEQVYSAITNPDQIVKWFPDKVEGSLDVGQQPVFSFTEQNHQTRIVVEASNPYDYFAYRWVPGGSSGLVDDVLKVPSTLVEFHIEETNGGTRIVLTESGFAALPSDVAEASFKDNSGGWAFMLGRLEHEMNGE
jgi:uncharacterized protein YndB with AHSA1/START domain